MAAVGPLRLFRSEPEVDRQETDESRRELGCVRHDVPAKDDEPRAADECEEREGRGHEREHRSGDEDECGVYERTGPTPVVAGVLRPTEPREQ